MKINDQFKLDDRVSGLRLKVIQGEKLDRLHIEIDPNSPVVRNRDFFFTRDGAFDGTGSACEPEDAAEKGLHAGGGITKPALMAERDPWAHRAEGMRCYSCMFYVPKVASSSPSVPVPEIGRCRRHAPTMGGYPAVFPRDWCGDHKLDERKV